MTDVQPAPTDTNDVTDRSPQLPQKSEAGVTELIKQRDRALRTNKAYATMLRAHGIKHDLDESQLQSLQVDGTEVVGEYAYTLPQVVPPAKTGANRGQSPASGLTEDRIKSMTQQEILDNWDEVRAVMARP